MQDNDLKVSLELTFAQLCSSYAASPVTADFHQQVDAMNVMYNLIPVSLLDCIFGVSFVLIEAPSDQEAIASLDTVSCLCQRLLSC